MTEPTTDAGALSVPKKREAQELALSEGFTLIPRNITELTEFSKLIAASSICPKEYQQRPGDVMVAVALGAEVGLKPMQALQNIAAINGKPTIYGDAALAVVRNSGLLLSFEEREPGEALKTGQGWCKLVRKDDPEHPTIRTFSVNDAKTANLWGKPGPWTQYPGRMLMFRARSWALRDGAGEVLKGLYIREEAEDFEVIGKTDQGHDLMMPRRKSGAVEPGAADAILKDLGTAQVPTSPSAPAGVDRSALKKVMVQNATEKQGGGKTYYAIAFEGASGGRVEATTFSKTDFETASGLKGKFALIATKATTKGDKTYTNLTHIEAAPEEAGEAPPQDEPGANG